jgi:hypothetical protein
MVKLAGPKGRIQMTKAVSRAKVVRVRREIGEGGWFYATSPDLKGLLVAEPDLAALDKMIPQAITDLYGASDIEVIVARVEDEGDMLLRSWVAIPTVLAKPLKASWG